MSPAGKVREHERTDPLHPKTDVSSDNIWTKMTLAKKHFAELLQLAKFYFDQRPDQHVSHERHMPTLTMICRMYKLKMVPRDRIQQRTSGAKYARGAQHVISAMKAEQTHINN